MRPAPLTEENHCFSSHSSSPMTTTGSSLSVQVASEPKGSLVTIGAAVVSVARDVEVASGLQAPSRRSVMAIRAGGQGPRGWSWRAIAGSVARSEMVTVAVFRKGG